VTGWKASKIGYVSIFIFAGVEVGTSDCLLLDGICLKSASLRQRHFRAIFLALGVSREASKGRLHQVEERRPHSYQHLHGFQRSSAGS